MVDEAKTRLDDVLATLIKIWWRLDAQMDRCSELQRIDSTCNIIDSLGPFLNFKYVLSEMNQLSDSKNPFISPQRPISIDWNRFYSFKVDSNDEFFFKSAFQGLYTPKGKIVTRVNITKNINVRGIERVVLEEVRPIVIRDIYWVGRAGFDNRLNEVHVLKDKRSDKHSMVVEVLRCVNSSFD
ncbi:hypothetical protein PIB30_011340 [Stylosanthes scabra]|uniref:Uncharacterized protein n=1 Tax=Stylosanthes scabra TaxID=79078 RepID=A0ABU6W5G2_9FABA|nr:hypothetical protein [Stylosanthes scabra]